jgi:hypothetical protein
MSNWPLEGGITGVVSVDRNLRGILRRGGELAATALFKAEAKELFPELATPGAKRLNTGTVQLEWPGASPTTSALEIVHGLGSTPLRVLGTARSNAVVASCTVRGTTKFTLRAWNGEGSPPAGSKVEVDWIAFT